MALSGTASRFTDGPYESNNGNNGCEKIFSKVFSFQPTTLHAKYTPKVDQGRIQQQSGRLL